ncbi:MAG: IS110 family transposase [Gammaproteobacteria bacterium]|nr:IS110 family transposase [Gammaproteobacteria bacterium]
MKLYAGIDLHSNNSVLDLLDEKDKVIYNKRLANDLPTILSELSPYQSQIEAIAIESTFNWYWLVDGLMEAGYCVHLVNTAAVQTYSGLKYTDDNHDARWLAHLLRLNILPTGYIYPKVDRAIRDLLRKRSQMVRLQTLNTLSIQNLIARNTGGSMKGTHIQRMTAEDIALQLPNEDHALAMSCNLSVLQQCHEQIKILESAILKRIGLRKEYQSLLTVPGIGKILALTIMLETGDISRFDKAGNFASYARCVQSKRVSNGKKKGENNRKNGNKYLAWAFVEAAHFSIRYSDTIKGFYQRKCAKIKKVIATKAVAHKLARACYYVIRDHVEFDVNKAFT